MRRVFVLLFLALAFGVFYAGANRSAVMAAVDNYAADYSDSTENFSAVIAFDSTVVNLGEVDVADEGRTCVFQFRNMGNAPLVLTYVHASCGCMRLTYPRHPIAPGDSGRISVVLSPAALPRGDFKRGVLVRSNAVNGKAVLNVVGKIIERIQ